MQHHLRPSVVHPVAPRAGEDHLVLLVISLLVRALLVLHVVVLLVILVLFLQVDPLHIRDDALADLPHILAVVLADEAAQGSCSLTPGRGTTGRGSGTAPACTSRTKAASA